MLQREWEKPTERQPSYFYFRLLPKIVRTDNGAGLNCINICKTERDFGLAAITMFRKLRKLLRSAQNDFATRQLDRISCGKRINQKMLGT